MYSYFGKPDVQRRANLNNKENDKGRIVFPLGTMPDMREQDPDKGICRYRTCELSSFLSQVQERNKN